MRPSLSTTVTCLIRAGYETLAVKHALKRGLRDQGKLTDLIFFARHPERNGRVIQLGEPNRARLVNEWASIRNQLIRPALRSLRGSAHKSEPIAPNSFIVVGSKAVLNNRIRGVITELEPYFHRRGLRVTVTSAYRPPEKQLDIIKRAAIKRGIDQKYPDLRTATVSDVASWRDAWDELLHLHKFIVNPPVKAFSRIRNRHYNPSPHSSGRAFDLSGADLGTIAETVRQYCRDRGGIGQILIETGNNAVHIGLSDRPRCEVIRK